MDGSVLHIETPSSFLALIVCIYAECRNCREMQAVVFESGHCFETIQCNDGKWQNVLVQISALRQVARVYVIASTAVIRMRVVSES